jgi:hypothetical protein
VHTGNVARREDGGGMKGAGIQANTTVNAAIDLTSTEA